MSDDRTPPKHVVCVAGYITNENGQVLLVKTYWRADTWEMPGGQVEEGEPLHEALYREVKEETGISIRPLGITGVYYNRTEKQVIIVFRAEKIGGELTTSDEIILRHVCEHGEACIGGGWTVFSGRTDESKWCFRSICIT